ncbi:MAG: hypothetical protein QM679_08155 [Patulibacter sp.]
MSPSHVLPTARSRRRLILALGAAAALAPASVASAATGVTLKLTDPAGDNTGGSGLDIRSATISHNTTTGAISAAVTFSAAPPTGAALAIGLGKASGGSCSVSTDSGVMSFLATFDATAPLGVWVLSGESATHQYTPTLSGSTFSAATGTASSLKKFSWDCATVSIQQTGANADDLVGDTASAIGTTAGVVQVIVQTDKPDKDKDGVPDVTDACPTVPGSTANGCLSIAAKKALRLGARRVVVDKLVARTATTCKATAKGTVYDGKKKIGSGTLDVGVHGSYCHISGVIKTKKHGKKVKVKIAGSGFKRISATIKK